MEAAQMRFEHPKLKSYHPVLFGPGPDLRGPYKARLMDWCRSAIALAKRRGDKKLAKGKRAATVTLTVEELLAKLNASGNRCALTGLEFWTDDGGSYGPTCPSIDRINPKGDYTDPNTRITLLGVNSLRGEGSDEDMYRIAEALIQHRDRPPSGAGRPPS
jgi:hypothetical protein